MLSQQKKKKEQKGISHWIKNLVCPQILKYALYSSGLGGSLSWLWQLPALVWDLWAYSNAVTSTLRGGTGIHRPPVTPCKLKMQSCIDSKIKKNAPSCPNYIALVKKMLFLFLTCGESKIHHPTIKMQWLKQSAKHAEHLNFGQFRQIKVGGNLFLGTSGLFDANKAWNSLNSLLCFGVTWGSRISWRVRAWVSVHWLVVSWISPRNVFKQHVQRKPFSVMNIQWQTSGSGHRIIKPTFKQLFIISEEVDIVSGRCLSFHTWLGIYWDYFMF